MNYWGKLLLLAAYAFGHHPTSLAQGKPDPGSSAEMQRTAMKLMEQGDLTGASRELLRAVRIHPDDAGPYNLLGVVRARQGDYGSAEANFLKAIARSPQFPGAYLNLGRLYQENSNRDPGAVEKAIGIYRKLLKHLPADMEANYQIAVLLQYNGLYRSSLEHLARLPAVDRERAQAVGLSCANHAMLGEVSRARELASQLLEIADLTEADALMVMRTLETIESKEVEDLQISMLTGLQKRGLASAETLHRLALLYERREQLLPARETLEREAAQRPLTAELLLDLARVAYKQRDHKGALGYLAHARELNPNGSSIHFFFGMVCVELDLGAEAYGALSKAVSLEPTNPYYNYAMGAVALHRRDPSEAIPYFRKYCDLKQDDPRGRLALGSAYFESADFGASRRELEVAMKHPETSTGASYFMARILRQEGKLSEAEDAVQRALAGNPDYADAQAELGLLRFRQKRYEEAQKALSRALELDPENYEGNFNLLLLYRRTKDERAEPQARRFEEVSKKRAQKTLDFLRTIEMRPYD